MPGPKPKYQPEFETEEIAEARRIARQRTAPSSHVHRAKMVVILSEHPDISHERLAQAVGGALENGDEMAKALVG